MLLRLFILLLASLSASASLAQVGGKTLVVLPFQNDSKAPGLDWIGEAFPETLNQRLAASAVFVIGREERNYAFDRMGIPTHVRPSRATAIRIAEELDADYVVFGDYDYDGKTFSCNARLLDLKRMRLLPSASESGPLPSLLEVQTSLAWDLLRRLDPQLPVARNQFLASGTNIRLDAFENYIRGVIATGPQDKIRFFKEAVRQNPAYVPPVFALAKTYFEVRDYQNAAVWFSRVPSDDAEAREANFYLGLSSYYLGQFERAETAFQFVAQRMPLGEVYNNLGVVAGRKSRPARAVDDFQRAVAADPRDADYRFNLAVALFRAGNLTAAQQQLREALFLRPSDSEAKSLLDALKSPGASVSRAPLERIKSNYDENSFRQLALEIYNAQEQRLVNAPPAEHSAAHVTRGRDLELQGFVAEAEKQFREAILVDPTNAAAHAGLARLLETSDPAKARNEAAASLRLHPTAEAYLVLARLDLRDNNAQGAEQNASLALQLEPANAAALELKRQIAAKLAEKAQPLPH